MSTNLQEGMRGLFQKPLLFQHYEKEDPKTFIETIWTRNSMGEYNLFQFDAYASDGTVHNILNEFYSWLVGNPQFFDRLVFDKYTSVYFEFKPKSIAKYIYGNTELYYIITLFNDIQHPSDLTRQYLKTQGLMYLNMTGMKALHDIIIFKRYVEANTTDAFKKVEF